MEHKSLSTLSNEALLKREKSIKVIAYMLAGVLLLLFIINIVNMIKKGFSALFAVPFALLPILIINFKNLNDIKKEKKSRNLSL